MGGSQVGSFLRVLFALGILFVQELSVTGKSPGGDRNIEWSVQSHANFAYSFSSKGIIVVFVKTIHDLNCTKVSELFCTR